MLLTQAEWEARQKKLGGEGSRDGKSQGNGGRGQGRGHGGGRGGRGGRGDGGKESTDKHDKSHIKCFKCHAYGHYANRCPGEKKNDEEAHHAKTVATEPTVLLAKMEEQGSLDPALCEIRHTNVKLEEEKVLLELCFAGEGEAGIMSGTWIMELVII